MFPVIDRRGLEVGGPSPIFMKRGEIPLYKDATNLSCVCYSANTVWNDAEPIFAPEQKGLGSFIEAEATDLKFCENDYYDYILSSHQLEHSANPVKVLHEFHRVLKPGGDLLLILPEKDHTFDHARPYTKSDHMIEDYLNNVGEDDLTHFGEIMHLHDLKRDPLAPQSVEGFAFRSMQNKKNRCLHHHVFHPTTTQVILRYAGFNLIASQEKGMHMIFHATKEIRS